MTLHLRRWRWWPILCPPSGDLIYCQKGCITGAVCSLLPAEPILRGTHVLPVVHFLRGSSHMSYTETITISKE